jgi:phosphoribosylformylglycinamidine synthase I
MKCGVVVFPGSNCDRDLIHVLEASGAEVTELWHKDTELPSLDFVFLPGGFSYGDYLRSGAIAHLSPIMGPVGDYAKAGGHVLGICNGFQILCESRLLPGALLRNRDQLFICENVFLKVENNQTAISSAYLADKAYKIPVAHAEGRYYADEDTISSLEANNQVLFRYCDENGEVNQSSNINGSVNNIAGICNAEGNVFGMMPHPERAASEVLLNTDGRLLFESIMAQAMKA